MCIGISGHLYFGIGTSGHSYIGSYSKSIWDQHNLISYDDRVEWNQERLYMLLYIYIYTYVYTCIGFMYLHLYIGTSGKSIWGQQNVLRRPRGVDRGAVA